ARVVALVAVVAHDEDVVGRHGERGAAEADAAALQAATGPEQRVRRTLHGRVRLAGEEGGVRVVPRLAVDVDLLRAHLDRLRLDVLADLGLRLRDHPLEGRGRLPPPALGARHAGA